MTVSPDGLECLMLAFPQTLEEDIIDICHSVEGIQGFSLMNAAGFGAGASMRSVSEEVRGRAARKVLMTVAPGERLRALLAELSRTLPTPEAAYWIVPVISFGRLA